MSDSYFLGSSSENGFFNCFNRFSDEEEYTYILKGGPGTGKSSIMRKVADELENKDIRCERYYCSSDPDSLDAVVFPSLKVNIVDGTSPHTAEPVFPGANGEIINLGECWNKKEIYGRKNEIISLTLENRELHGKCRRLIASAGSLFSDGRQIYKSCVDAEKVRKYASHTAAKKFKRLSSKIGVENKKLLEAVTPKGCIFKSDTVTGLCDERIIIKDEFGIAAEIFMKEIRDYALSSGYDVISSPCIFDGKSIRHIVIKSLSVGFFTSDLFFTPEVLPTKVVSMRRFYDFKKLNEHKMRLAFLKKASAGMMKDACEDLKYAKEIHDKLEKIYISSMDFNKLDSVTETLIKRVWASEWHPSD